MSQSSGTITFRTDGRISRDLENVARSQGPTAKTFIVAKTMDSRGAEAFWEVLRTGAVTFDSRPDWVLIAAPIGAAPRKQDLRWVHPTEIRFVWIRPFTFADQAISA